MQSGLAESQTHRQSSAHVFFITTQKETGGYITWGFVVQLSFLICNRKEGNRVPV